MPAKKSVAKKAAPKKTAAKKMVTEKAVKQPAAPKKAATKTAKKSSAPKARKQARKSPAPAPAQDVEKTKEIVLSARKRTSTPSLFKPGKRGNTPILFTMEDVAQLLKQREEAQAKEASTAPKPAGKATKKKPAVKAVKAIEADAPVEHRNHGAASLMDILGFDPSVSSSKLEPGHGREAVPVKWQAYYDLLIDLRNHLREGLDYHTEETLKRSSKEDSGDLSGYGQHMADAGTDAFDRDFALSLVSSEQEALYEIEEAIQRIYDGTYGVCEETGEPIAQERLEAVPFTRYSLQGQRQLEKTRRGRARSGALFNDMEGGDYVMSDDSE
jgi:RNA polymerase-binding transcription factor DksA